MTHRKPDEGWTQLPGHVDFSYRLGSNEDVEIQYIDGLGMPTVWNMRLSAWDELVGGVYAAESLLKVQRK